MSYETSPRRAHRRHSNGVSLARRGEGLLPHHYRDETDSDGGKTALRRLVRRRGRQVFRAETAEFLNR